MGRGTLERMDRTVLLEHARSVRDLTINLARRFTAEEAFRIPPGCGNCPIWNVGHIAIVQERLVLAAFGKGPVLPEAYHTLFGEGWCGCDWNGNRPDWEEVVSCLDPLRERVEAFIGGGVDLGAMLVEPYMTATGIVLNTLADSLSFSTLHEAIHVGVLSTYARLLTRPRGGG